MVPDVLHEERAADIEHICADEILFFEIALAALFLGQAAEVPLQLVDEQVQQRDLAIGFVVCNPVYQKEGECGGDL